MHSESQSPCSHAGKVLAQSDFSTHKKFADLGVQVVRLTRSKDSSLCQANFRLACLGECNLSTRLQRLYPRALEAVQEDPGSQARLGALRSIASQRVLLGPKAS